MKLTIITSIICLLNNILRTVKKITSFIRDYKQNKDIKKKYEEGHDAVENGDVEDLNDIFKNRKN